MSTQIEATSGPRRKRRRKVLACSDCRKRKIQCDRRLPFCARCERAGRASSCTYEHGTYAPSEAPSDAQALPDASSTDVAVPTQPVPSSVTISTQAWNDLLARLLQQEKEIAKLQFHQFSGAPATSNGLPDRETETQDAGNGSDQVTLLRGHGFRTKYFGPTNSRVAMTYLHEISEYRKFVIEVSPVLSRATKDMWALKAANKVVKAARRAEPVQDLASLLPTEDEGNRLVGLYLELLENTFCVLHVPSFMSDYALFWSRSDSRQEAFVCLLLALMSCASCLDIVQPWTYVGESSSAREKACVWIDACESWLDKQSFKRTGMIHVQIRCLLIISKMTNHVHSKRTWIDSGRLIDILLHFGFHRSPSAAQKSTSVFDQEMRARLWTLAVELDIQTSLDKGMPCHSRIALVDVGRPANVFDEDMTPSTTDTLQTRPLTETTKSTYLHASRSSLQLRSHLASLLLETGWSLTLEDVMQYAEQINHHLDSLAIPDRAHHSASLHPSDKDISGSGGLQLGLLLLTMQMHELLCILYSSALEHCDARTVTTRFLIQGFLDAATSRLRIHEQLMTANNHSMILTRNDLVRMTLWTARRFFVDDGRRSLTMGESRSCMDLIKKALGMLEARFERIGVLEPSNLVCFAAYDFLKNKHNEQLKDDDTWSSVDRLSKLCSNLAASQDPEFRAKVEKSEHGQPTPQSLEPNPGENLDPTFSYDLGSSNDLFNAADLMNISNWPYEDWMLDQDFAGGQQAFV